MKVDQQTLAYIQNVVETARLVKIENIIIEPNKVRAMDEDRTVLIFQNKDVPSMSFGSIGLNRIDIFESRYNMAKSCSTFEVNVILDEKQEFARALVMKAKGFKIDYRCANPATIQAPKNLQDTIKCRVKMTPEAVQLMSKGTTAMGADEVKFVGSADGVSFEMEDINKDVLSYTFTTEVEMIDDNSPIFSHKYPVKILLALFKQNPETSFFLTSKGMIKITVNTLDLYIPPRA